MINLDDGIKYVPGAETRNLIAEPAADTSFVIKKYSPWSNALNLHSWLVTADDPIWGIELRSDNIMNNVSYCRRAMNTTEITRYHGPYIDARLGMWFPETRLWIQ